MVGYDVQLHYQCSFILEKKNETAVWADIVRIIRRWVALRYKNDERLGKHIFFTGGELISPFQPRLRVETKSCVGNGNLSTPQYWAMRYEHPCDDIVVRQWQTDVGLTRVGENQYRFILTTVHALKRGYIGEEPEPPIPTAPRVVSLLMQSENWVAKTDAGEILSVNAIPLEVGATQEFREILELKRRFPIVLITLDPETGKPLIEPKRLANLLAGTARVYFPTTPVIDEEIEWMWPKHLRCQKGAIRIYQEAVMFDKEEDGARHRYIKPEDIFDRSTDAVIEMIVRGVVRRGRINTVNSITSIDDLIARQREIRYNEMKATINDSNYNEMLKYLEESIGEIETENKILKENKEIADEEIEELREQKRKLIYEKQILSDKINEIAKKNSNQKEKEYNGPLRRAVYGDPSVKDALHIINEIFPDRLVVLDSAWKSAEEAECFLYREKAYKLMKQFVTEYWEKMESGAGDNEARQIFKDAFAARESDTVEKNKKARQLRIFRYRDKPVEMMRHLKIGNKESPSATWRMHFLWDAEDKKLVIGHCGKHLDQG